jgi:hypothetical protein
VSWLLVRVRQWRGRSGEWMAAIDSFTPVKALGLGFLLAGVNTKNLLMAGASGVAIGAAGESVVTWGP